MLLDLSRVWSHLIHLLGFKKHLWLVHLLGKGDHWVWREVGVQGRTETRGLQIFRRLRLIQFGSPSWRILNRVTLRLLEKPAMIRIHHLLRSV